MARRCQARLILVHVVPAHAPVEPETGMSPLDTERLNYLESAAGQRLASLCEGDALSDVEHETVVGSGEVWNGISRIIKERNVKLVVYSQIQEQHRANDHPKLR